MYIITLFVIYTKHLLMASNVTIVLILIALKEIYCELVTVSITQGTLVGNVEISSRGQNYYAFRGIPYAKPPIGKLRFKPPEPPDRWSGKRDARFFKSHCPQLSLVPEVGVTGSEDCLFLNIYTTHLPEDFCGNETKKAVMVFFHGGDFKCGTPDIFGPDYLLTEDVILITVTSRLGVLGYLNLDNCEVEGNAGLKDQVMALKWVKSEIDHFCGDSSKVMIFGQGSGGTQVQLHILSEKSHGLFQRASSESGTVFNDWSFRRSTLDRAIKLAQILGCQSTAVRRIESCFQNMPADLIVKHQDAVLTPEEILLGVTIPFPPTVEKCRKSKNRFISELPIHIVKEGYFEQVPYMVTINSAEGLIHFKKIDEVRMVQLDEDLQIFVPQALGFRYNSRASINLANALRTFYFQGKSMSEDLLSVIQLYSDIWYANGVLQTANLMAPYSMYPIYFGIFSFDGQFNYYKKVIVNTSIPGACHGDDLGYKFYISSLQDNYKGDEEEKTINYTVRIWANFAKTGNPTPKKDSMIKKQWHPVLPSQLNYFQLADNIRNYRRYRKKGTQFWIKVFKSIQ